MMNNGLPHPDYEKYKGLRALEFLRVSTPEQEKMFGWPRQHAEITKKLIDPLNLRVIHTIKDSYTGLEFEMRDALDEALDMAKKRKYDILILDMLDRLGRKGIEREIYLMELKQEGVRVVSADPDDHSDDDSSWGEIIRYLKGKGSEEEIKNMRHRTMGGKRAKATGDPEKGIPPMIVGNGHRRYGYDYVLDERGKRIGLKIKYDVILTDANGTEWTEPKVVEFIFESSASGMSIVKIADTLNQMGIPSPYVAKGIQRKKTTKWEAIWHPCSVHAMLKDKGYAGVVTLFKTATTGRKSGKRYSQRRKTDASEQVTIEIPAIISMELYEKVQIRLKRNSAEAKRHADDPENFLLRAGLVRCGYCGRVMYGDHKKYRNHLPGYRCTGRYGVQVYCKGCWINAREVDAAAWARALEFIRNPELVDQRVAERRKKDPTKKKRAEIKAKIQEIQQQQQVFRTQLRDLMLEGKLDQGTKDFLTSELNQLATREEEWNDKLIDTENQQEEWKKVDKKLTEIHETCKRVRENLSDPNYVPTYQEKRDLIEFFNIRAIVWRHDHNPRFNIEARPEEIASYHS
ncbi:MAG TPA: recombinase family protein [Ktedonobacteraceae bacterium]|nr:recombinase family protein [Ktedonobacteraceae bacterium]